MTTDNSIKLIYVDLFCGAGGTSTGVEKAKYRNKKCCKVVACVNHDKNAIASHKANHPDALHFNEDMRTVSMEKISDHLALARRMYPNALVVLWASLECTNFSRAKGGQPRNADSRTLAEHLYRYIAAIDPDFIQIENVQEFMSWGPLDENGKPISKLAGTDYTKWRDRIKEDYFYDFDFRILNAADYGARTSRKRFFGIFAKYGLPIVFPEPTHAKNPAKGQKKWRAVKDVLDFEDEGVSIFGRKKPLSEKTLKRIEAGVIRFVGGGKDKFMIKYNSMNQKGKYQAPGVDDPCPVVSCQNRLGLAQVNFLSKQFSGHPDSKNVSLEGPAGTVTTIDHHALVHADFIQAYYGSGDNVHSVCHPAPTVTTKDRLAYVVPDFIVNYYSGGGQLADLEKPCPAVLVKPKQSLVQCRFMDQQFGNSKPASIEAPSGAITANPKYNLVSCEPWIMDTSFSNIGGSINDPSRVITANRKHHYLMNPQFNSSGGSVDNPAFTLIARMDKMPPYLVSTETGHFAIEIYESDSPMTKRLKVIMAMYGIVDIKMRMLKIPELKQIMGFPKDYVLIGTKAEQKKYIGNAVETTIACALSEALVEKLEELGIAA
nr:DNA cytosine methyltransferase [Parabacteroides goldsteinii]